MAIPTQYTSRITVPLPSEEEVRKVIGDTYDPEKVLHVFTMSAGTGDMYFAIVGLVRAISRAEEISPKIREMIILRCAKILDSPHDWQANAVLAKKIGLADDEILAASSDGPVECIDAQYVLVSKATDELSLTATLQDETLSALLSSFDVDICRKVILMISWFNLLSRFNNGCRVPLETTDNIGSNASPLNS
jgi:alkylhydroperoxidase family enzyme